ncbi:uncharacterized protein LOC134851657 isoform X2 [Symsagittifera roscoffensis]|uniref:uncharacterized protein LOC134851657 isoform X2 n=1 Tax=Symsagittifera roscoffensis TaxID=84072 RepID=UPI00307CC1EA
MTEVSNRRGIMDTYRGEKSGDFRHGVGCYSYNSFYQYQGTWSKGLKHGPGQLILRDGTRIHGEFKEGELTGNGIKVWPDNKQVYRGTFLNGHIHGHGEMTYSDGSTYVGQFMNNKRDGYGTLTDKSGVYNGQFQQNKRAGKGMQMFEQNQTQSAACYTGQWRENLFHGRGKFSVDGYTIIANFKDGKPEQIPTKYKIEVNNASDFTVEKGHPFDINVSLVDQNGDPVEGFSGLNFTISCWYNIEKIQKFIDKATKTPQNILDMAARLSAMPMRRSPYLSAVYPMVKFQKFVLSADISKWDTKQVPDSDFSSKAIDIIREGPQDTEVNFFTNFPNMTPSFPIPPTTGQVDIRDTCLPGDMKESYPPLLLDKLKREWEELQKEESKKTRVVYFGDRPRDVKFDALGQPILVASAVEATKNKNTKLPIDKILRKHYAHTGEYLLVVADDSPSGFFDWFGVPKIKQSFVRLKVQPSHKDKDDTN